MKSNNRKILFILIAAILCAALGGFGLYRFLSPKKVTMWVFRDNYTAGTQLTDEMLMPVQVDSSVMVAGATSDAASQFVIGSAKDTVVNQGDSLRINVAQGMPLTPSILSAIGGSAVEKSMDPSKVAVTIPISSVSGRIAGLKENSRINIYATGYDENMSTVLLFQGLRILSLSSDNSGVSGITVEVTTGESLKLINAMSYTTLSFALVNSSGYQYEEGNLSYTPDAGLAGAESVYSQYTPEPEADAQQESAVVEIVRDNTDEGGQNETETADSSTEEEG